MMTSANGSIFRVTGPLRGEFTGHQWIPPAKASDAELWFFFDLRLNQPFSKQWRRWWFESPWRSLWRHCNATVKSEIRFWGQCTVSANAIRPWTARIHAGVVLTNVGSYICRWQTFNSQLISPWIDLAVIMLMLTSQTCSGTNTAFCDNIYIKTVNSIVYI